MIMEQSPAQGDILVIYYISTEAKKERAPQRKLQNKIKKSTTEQNI